MQLANVALHSLIALERLGMFVKASKDDLKASF